MRREESANAPLDRCDDLAGKVSHPGEQEEIVAWHLLERYHALGAQQFVRNPGRDLRVIVIDFADRVLSLSGLHGTRRDREESALPVPAGARPCHTGGGRSRAPLQRVFGVDMGTADIGKANRGLVVIEVNSSA
jgi:hypothetical protein